MTASISLFAMLGGTPAEPAGSAPPSGDDAALFAAALVAALQQLQTPVAARAAVPVPQTNSETQVAEGEVSEEAVTEGEPSSEQRKGGSTLGQLLDTNRPTAEEGAAEADAPQTPQRIEGKSEQPQQIDVVSDEPAGPKKAEPKKTRPKGEARGDAPIAGKRSATAVQAKTPHTGATTVTAPVAHGDATADDCSEVPEAPADAITDQPGMQNHDPAPRQQVKGKTRSANKGVVLVGHWSPAPSGATGWKPPVEGRSKAETRKTETEEASSETTPEPSAPVSAAAPLVAAPVVIPAPAALTTPESSSEPSEPAPQRPAPAAAPSVDQVADLDSPSDSVRQAQVANARLAVQLAELVGDRNVTEFRVELSKVKRKPESSGAPVDIALPDENTPAVVTPHARVPVVAKGEPGSEPTAQLSASPKPVKSEETPAPVRQTVTANRLLDLTDGPRISEPLRAARAAAGPIVPVPRKEIPVSAQPEKNNEAVEPARPRLKSEPPSDAPSASSSVVQGRSEGLTSRNDTPATGETRAARDLPNEASGNDRPAGSADRVTVQVSDAEGRQTRIRVSVLGDQVRAVIVPPDSESARQLEQRMDDLQTALARQGFASSKVSVQQAGETAVERNSATFASAASGGESKAASPGREQPAGEQRQGRGQREQQHQHSGDGHRHPHGRSRDQGAQHRRRYSDV